MWMTELATKTRTADSRTGSQSDKMHVICDLLAGEHTLLGAIRRPNCG